MSDDNSTTKRGSEHGVVYADEVPVEEIEALMLSKAKKEDEDKEGKSGKSGNIRPKGILKKQEGKTGMVRNANGARREIDSVTSVWLDLYVCMYAQKAGSLLSRIGKITSKVGLLVGFNKSVKLSSTKS